MDKSATTIDEQLTLLESRGLIIEDKGKAKEILLDIGYYRMGFYLFPFEKSYPKLINRTHEYHPGFCFEDAVSLYYFDFDLRLLLMRYLNRIEIAFRTAMVYYLSNKYKGNSIWFMDKGVVRKEYIKDFERKIYTSDFKRNPIIHRHHQNNPNDRFAPAWKTLEFMTFGAVLKLYEQLKVKEDKIFIANQFGVRQVVTFENYMHTIRHIRNACAHGSLLFGLKLPQGIRKGPAANLPRDRYNIKGALRVMKYMMGQISENRAVDMSREVGCLFNDLCETSPHLEQLMLDFSDI